MKKMILIAAQAVLMIMIVSAIGCSKQQEVKNMSISIRSPAFKENEMIPQKYTCDGENINPPLIIEDVPDNARSIALIMDDPDAPMGTFVHWVVYNIPASSQTIGEDHAPGLQGVNNKGEKAYTGPCPPSGTHRYFFKVYALDTELELDEDADKGDLKKSMEGHILAKDQLVGLYKRG